MRLKTTKINFLNSQAFNMCIQPISSQVKRDHKEPFAIVGEATLKD